MGEHIEGIKMSGGNLSGKQITVGFQSQATQNNTYINKEIQPLADAVAEIQRLLQQLENTNPTATEHEQLVYVDVAIEPTLKQRSIAALKDGGETAIDEFVLENKYLKVIKAIAKGWLKPS
jgi:hypothetical protein